ncbi:type IV toxin-antitoxin system AbiEi family antitoxin domain-containing protein [Lentzea albidocapillata]|uniref:Transcriptional regulator, AbiEi antitoxin, Type IV TA system n=1 Tax=Lentzea albidocapillata TaxID=40571 RepID=A0A1W2ETX2_9PSEU|nr:type IV toxin-antitoxin system AbiEi family antitoxin domain-containing protein [Lentzea albidocapillata]SMD12628.1 Transcriptional regulator, AbiEi antitoxin, Type IV TA system [Lentzea albidocapillata]
MEAIRALELLGVYTAGQWGMVTTKQALNSGIDDVTLHRLKSAGLLESVRRGVHAVTSAEASNARSEQAAWLTLRPEVAGWTRPKLDPDGGVVSHQSAARLHNIGDLVNSQVEITTPRRRTTRDPGVRLRRGQLAEADVMVLDGLPVTTPLRTIYDLLGQHADASHVGTIVRQAVEAGQVHLDELAERIQPHARSYGAKPPTGVALLELLLAQIGLSVQELATRPVPALGWRDLRGHSWDDLKTMNVTWGQLAEMSPETLQRLLQMTDPGRAAEQPEET